MSARFKNVDRDTPMMLPPSLQDWVDPNDMVHFVINTVEAMNLPQLKVNHRGTGSAQYPPYMMLALILYCYANGIMSSRKIETATWNLVPVRYLTGNTHPDHATISAFRKENAHAIKEAFQQLLHMAHRMNVLKIGTVSIDGTHIKAHASKYKNVRFDRAMELEQQIQQDIAELLAQAEAADRQDSDDGQRLPEEIASRQALLQKIQDAKQALEEQAREKEQRRQDREDRDNEDDPPASRRDPQEALPEDTSQMNLVDPDSTLMRKSVRDGWEQAYNAQAVVDADGSQLILGAYVTKSPTDHYELEPALETIDPELGRPMTVLADAGYARKKLIERFESDPEKPELYVAISSADHDERRYDYRPQQKRKKRKVTDPVLVKMQQKVRSEQGRMVYRKRKQTVEPVFGIIKTIMGLDQFLRRGFKAVNDEWDLVCTAYNIKRLWRLASI